MKNEESLPCFQIFPLPHRNLANQLCASLLVQSLKQIFIILMFFISGGILKMYFSNKAEFLSYITKIIVHRKIGL